MSYFTRPYPKISFGLPLYNTISGESLVTATGQAWAGNYVFYVFFFVCITACLRDLKCSLWGWAWSRLCLSGRVWSFNVSYTKKCNPIRTRHPCHLFKQKAEGGRKPKTRTSILSHVSSNNPVTGPLRQTTHLRLSSHCKIVSLWSHWQRLGRCLVAQPTQAILDKCVRILVKWEKSLVAGLPRDKYVLNRTDSSQRAFQVPKSVPLLSQMRFSEC